MGCGSSKNQRAYSFRGSFKNVMGASNRRNKKKSRSPKVATHANVPSNHGFGGEARSSPPSGSPQFVSGATH